MTTTIRVMAIVLGLLGVLVAIPAAHASAPTTRERLASLGGVPCPDGSVFTCVTLTVPLDHFNPSDTRTLDVVFAVLPASGARKGMFVTVVGGPGVAGVTQTDYYTSFFAPEIHEVLDIVFFDQRGIGLSGGLDCYQAASKYYKANWSAATPSRAQKLKDAARTFAKNCYKELGRPEILPYLSTAQAVEDLELFRQAMGDNKFWLYGESYGTQYVQTYTAAHTDHLAGIILDGTVDLTLEGIPYYANAAQASNDALVASAAQCHETPKCQADFPMRPLRAYDRLAALLKSGKQTVSFPLGNGTRVNRKFGYDDLDTTGEGSMYGQGGRMMFMRALAAYARNGDLVPMMRLFYPNLGVDENTLQPYYDPTWSDAYYYAVECQDYGYFQGNKNSRADQYIVEALPVELSPVRLTALIWGDFPCVYWKNSPQIVPRPDYIAATGVPAFVLNAIADPITPLNNALAVYEHLDDGYLILQRGGPHVIFARGNHCIDDPVTAFLVSDILPAQREIECGGKVMQKYVPLAPLDSADFPSLLAAFHSVETEINYLPEFWYWDYETTTSVGCPFSGTLKFISEPNRVFFELNNCAFSKGFVMTGNAAYHYSPDRFWFNGKVTGYKNCTLSYNRKGANTTLTGECDGKPVNESGGMDVTDLARENRRETNRVTHPRAR